MAGEMLIRIYVQTRLGPILSPCVCVCATIGNNCFKVHVQVPCSGLITRSQAEELLDEKEVHSFLIRLSDKVWGYTISYRCEERIKHFLIDACNFKKVKFDGNSEKLHKDLHALISFHEVNMTMKSHKKPNM